MSSTFTRRNVTAYIQHAEALPDGTMGEQKIKMERFGHLRAISHTWWRKEPNALPDLEWAERSYLWWQLAFLLSTWLHVFRRWQFKVVTLGGRKQVGIRMAEGGVRFQEVLPAK